MSLSDQAREYVASQEESWRLSPPQPKDLDAANIEAYRAQHRVDYASDAETILSHYSAETVESTMGGVPTLALSVGESTGAILYFFGGAFVAGGPDEDFAITARLAQSARRLVCGPRYPLAPENPFPAAVDAGVGAYADLLSRYEASQVAFAGQSAGGNLVIAVTLAAMEAGLPPPASAVAFSPAADLSLGGFTATLDLDPTMKPQERWDQVMASYVGESEVNHPLISPIHARFPAGFPPTLITTGTRDFLLSDCVRLHQSMRGQGLDAEIRVWDGLWHVFEHRFGLPEGEASIDEAAEFIVSRS